jgi:large subunit ribosomal protein L23
MNAQERIIDTLRAPIVSEKTALLGAVNQYAFAIAPAATKADVKAAVEQLFEVTVERVNIVNTRGKAKSFRFRTGTRQRKRKAYVRLAAGQTIDVMARA